MADSEHTYREPDRIADMVWIPEEYEAGYSARFQNVAECITATPCWRAGWQDAGREIAGAAFAEEMFRTADVTVRWSLFGTGSQARGCGLPFDKFSPESWKRSWVKADIALSLAERQRSA